MIIFKIDKGKIEAQNRDSRVFACFDFDEKIAKKFINKFRNILENSNSREDFLQSFDILTYLMKEVSRIDEKNREKALDYALNNFSSLSLHNKSSFDFLKNYFNKSPLKK